MEPLFCEKFEGDLRSHLANPEASFALASWTLARKTDDLPTEADFRKCRIEWLMQDMMVLRYNADGALFYEHYGRNIVTHAQFDMSGKLLSEFRGPIGEFYRDCYSRVERERQPLATVHRLGRYNERPMWERVILPVIDDSGLVAFHVVNKVRKLEDDIASLNARWRHSGVIALQFLRDGAGTITDGMISGANAAARTMTGRRLDELLDQSIRDVFPGVMHLSLWERYLQVAETRIEQEFQVDYRLDGLDDRFDVRLYPFRDGVAIEFKVLPREPSQGKGLAA